MILARVVGTVVATRKDPRLEGKKLLILKPISPEGKDRFSVKFKMPITIRPNEWYISSEMTLQGRQGASSIEKETWATVKNRQADVNFQFQVHPIKDNSGVFEYAVPQVIFNLLK